MESSIKVLSQYRLDRAKEDLKSAHINHESGMYKAALNRAYYAIFHAMRVVVVLNGFDSSKHEQQILHTYFAEKRQICLCIYGTLHTGNGLKKPEKPHSYAKKESRSVLTLFYVFGR